MRHPVVLFDLDGTLTDPKDGITRCISYALECMGSVTPPADSLLFAIGPPLRGSFATLLETDDPRTIERAMTLYRQRFANVGLFENSVYAGVPAMLSSLTARGCKILLATAKPREYAHRILQHFGLLASFSGVYGGEFDGTRQHKGDLLAYLLVREQIDPADRLTVMVGDRSHDIDAAHANGCTAIGVSWGYGSVGELAGADMHCASPADLADLLARGNSRTSTVRKRR